MVELRIERGRLAVRVKGLHKLLAFRHRLRFPLSAVRSVRRGVPSGWKGLRAPGTHVPWLIAAGTFYRDGRRVFWDVRNEDRAVTIELSGQRFDRLVVEVEDPEDASRRLRAALGDRGPT